MNNQIQNQPYSQHGGPNGQGPSVLASAALNLLQGLNGEQQQTLCNALSLLITTQTSNGERQGHGSGIGPGCLGHAPSIPMASTTKNVPSNQTTQHHSFNQYVQPIPLGNSSNLAGIMSQTISQQILLRQLSQHGIPVNANNSGTVDLLSSIQSLADTQSSVGQQQRNVGRGGAGFNSTSNPAQLNLGFSTISAGTLTAAPAAAAERSTQEASNFNFPSAFTTAKQSNHVGVQQMPFGGEMQRKQAEEITSRPSASRGAIGHHFSATPEYNSAHLAAGSVADVDSVKDRKENRMIIACPARKMPWDHNQYVRLILSRQLEQSAACDHGSFDSNPLCFLSHVCISDCILQNYARNKAWGRTGLQLCDVLRTRDQISLLQVLSYASFKETLFCETLS
jgi:hypothetical protein